MEKVLIQNAAGFEGQFYVYEFNGVLQAKHSASVALKGIGLNLKRILLLWIKSRENDPS